MLTMNRLRPRMNAWDVLNQMHAEFNRELTDWFSSSASAHKSPLGVWTKPETTGDLTRNRQGLQQTVRPRADIYEAGDAWFVVLEMPGVDEHGTDISCEKNVLTVTGQADEFDTEEFDHQFGDFSVRRYERVFRLPDEVNVAGIEAHVKNGVLRLRLPKAEAAMPHKITVSAG